MYFYPVTACLKWQTLYIPSRNTDNKSRVNVHTQCLLPNPESSPEDSNILSCNLSQEDCVFDTWSQHSTSSSKQTPRRGKHSTTRTLPPSSTSWRSCSWHTRWWNPERLSWGDNSWTPSPKLSPRVVWILSGGIRRGPPQRWWRRGFQIVRVKYCRRRRH